MKVDGLRLRRSCLGLIATFFIAGCVHVSRPITQFPSELHWSGRLAVKVHTNPPQAFSADFELGGTPQQGELLFFTPLGTTAARLQWAPGVAVLVADGETRSFDSLNALALQATGTELPVEALFDWLRGRAADAPGWVADLTSINQGRVYAVREAGALPRVELRLVLQP